jgi:hypothetical protein
VSVGCKDNEHVMLNTDLLLATISLSNKTAYKEELRFCFSCNSRQVLPIQSPLWRDSAWWSSTSRTQISYAITMHISLLPDRLRVVEDIPQFAHWRESLLKWMTVGWELSSYSWIRPQMNLCFRPCMPQEQPNGWTCIVPALNNVQTQLWVYTFKWTYHGLHHMHSALAKSCHTSVDVDAVFSVCLI